MNGNLMDTNVVVRILNGDTNLVQQLKQYNNLCSSSVVLGELLYGAEKSARSAENRTKAIAFCSRFKLFPVDNNVSDAYGTLKHNLLASGNVMPENDIWIAASAMAHDLSVVTADKHFSYISGITIENR